MLTAYARRALELPPHVALEKAVRLAGRLIAARLQHRRDLSISTYVTDGPSNIVSRIAISADQVPSSLSAILPALVQRYLQHRFDLLGSGWVQVRYGMTAAGVEGFRFPPGPTIAADKEGRWLGDRVTTANLPEATRLWRLIEGPYEPIDWHLDFKSGFRWDCRCYFRQIAFGDQPGADVKVPWELARLQHLPQLATAHLLAKAGRPGFDAPDVYAREVRNQILDFLATNPPRFGVNWACPMDVGIRAANIVLAVDLLRAGGRAPDVRFEEAVARGVVAHARHILAHLEWSTVPRSNHYLSNLAGVLFCAVYLPAGDETDSWLDFSAQQLGEEIVAQFLADGGNFEGSTNYHRLSAEVALFATAALLGVAAERPEAFKGGARHRLQVRPRLGSGIVPSTSADDGVALPLPRQAVERLERAIASVAGWSKPNGHPPQIGDNDSGRLFKLHPIVLPAPEDLRDDALDHRAILSAEPALFPELVPDKSAGEFFDGVVLAALARQRKLPSVPPQPEFCTLGADADLAALVARIRALPPGSRRETVFGLPGFSPKDFRREALADFGLFVFKNDTTFLSFRCAAYRGAPHTMGHYHDDNLAIELHHRGADLITDPGSYLYTPVIGIRSRYRTAAAHFVPRPKDRAAASEIGPFEMRFKATARPVYVGPSGIGAILEAGGWQAYRAVLLDEGRATIVDGCAPDPLSENITIPVSGGYGRLTNLMSVTLPASIQAQES